MLEDLPHLMTSQVNCNSLVVVKWLHDLRVGRGHQKKSFYARFIRFGSLYASHAMDFVLKDPFFLDDLEAKLNSNWVHISTRDCYKCA